MLHKNIFNNLYSACIHRTASRYTGWSVKFFTRTNENGNGQPD